METFEGCISFIEDYLGIKLLYWQKMYYMRYTKTDQYTIDLQEVSV